MLACPRVALRADESVCRAGPMGVRSMRVAGAPSDLTAEEVA
jgi:hypothetical protein